MRKTCLSAFRQGMTVRIAKHYVWIVAEEGIARKTGASCRGIYVLAEAEEGMARKMEAGG